MEASIKDYILVMKNMKECLKELNVLLVKKVILHMSEHWRMTELMTLKA